MLRVSYITSATLATAILGLCASAAAALDLPDCELRLGRADSCSPIVACMPGDGVYFVGRAVGWNSGTLAGETNTGVTCTGTWTVRNMVGLGQADFACDDGLEGSVIYYYQDSLTGTARGSGLTNRFGRVQGWSGHNIVPFLDARTGRVDGELMCGPEPMLLSRIQAAWPDFAA